MSSNLVAGRKPVLEVLKHSPVRVEACYQRRGSNMSSELTELLKLTSVYTLAAEEFDQRFSSLKHQGIVCKLTPLQSVDLKSIISEPGPMRLVVLDQVVDPHNLGAILRVAEATAVKAVVRTERRSAALTDAAKKASAGASELVPLITVVNLQRTLTQLKDAGFWIVGLALDEKATNVFETKLPQRVALVLGSEGKGLRQLTAKESDMLVKIPMCGALQSLNVSQAAAVTLYYLASQPTI